MLVTFIDKNKPTIIFEKEYLDILPLLNMIEQKATINIFFDLYGNKEVHGRLYDYEYNVKANDNKEDLLVYIDCYDNNVTN